MEDYELGETLGGGSFAVVVKAKEKHTGEDVAFKILKKKYSKWEDCLELRECKSLQKLHEEHLSFQKGIENIIKLKQIIYEKDGTLNLVFEYMQKNLFELMKEKSPKHFSESQIKAITYQTLQGLSFMHKYGFFHRDLKPENLLIKDETVKIADFGLAREIRSVPPYTEYVSTRYYRAPECILKSTNYNSPVDIWALGCIMAEMYLHPLPLFVGNNEKEVLYKICSILGTPTHMTWLEGIQQAKLVNIKFPNFPGTPLEQIIPKASCDAIDLMNQMLNWDPNKRATANALLQHPFFTRFPMLNRISTPDYDNTVPNKQSSIKKYSNKPKNAKSQNQKIPVTESISNKEEDLNKILDDTKGFEKFLMQLKNETNSADVDKEKEKEKEQISSMKKSLNENLYDKELSSQSYIPLQNNTIIINKNLDNPLSSSIQISNTLGNKYDSPIKERKLDFDIDLPLNFNDKTNRKKSAMNHLDRNKTEGVLPQKSKDPMLYNNNNNSSNTRFAYKNSDFKLPSNNSPRLQPSILKADYSRRNKPNAFNDSGNIKKDSIGLNDSSSNKNDFFKKIDSDMIIGDSHFNRRINKSPQNEYEVKHFNSNTNNNSNTSPNHNNGTGSGNEILFGMESRRGKMNANSNANNYNTSNINNIGSFWVPPSSSSMNKGEFI